MDTQDIWVRIILEVSSNVSNGQDLLFDNPLTVTIPAYDTVGSFLINIIDDSESEINEQIMLAIESVSDNAITGPDSEHVVEILDNDFPLNIHSSWLDEEINFRLYPNPNNGTFFIQSMNECAVNTIRVFNMNSRIVPVKLFRNGSLPSGYKMELTANPGLYFITFSCGEKKIVKRIFLSN